MKRYGFILLILVVFSLVFGANYFREATVFIKSVSMSSTLSVTGEVTLAASLNGSTLITGRGTFKTTAAADTIVNTDFAATDNFIVTPYGAKGLTVDQQDVLHWAPGDSDTLFVYRLASGASGLTYSYIRIK